MANEISHRHTATDETLYFTIRNTARQMWNTSGTPDFEALTVANWGDYDVALSETPADSYFYVGDFPAISGNMIAGWYWVDILERAGESPAIGDTLLASYFGYWDGTTYKFWADDVMAANVLVETGVTLLQTMQRIAAVIAGKTSGGGTGTETFTGLDGSTDRVEVTISDGNRTAVDYDPE